MRNQIFTQALGLGSMLLLATSCATTGGGVTDQAAAEKSKAYLDGLAYVASGSAGGVCAMPTAAQKTALSATAAPSKDWQDLLQKASACAGDKNWKTLQVVAETLARTDINAPWGSYFMSVAAEAAGDWQRGLWMIELAQKKAGVPSGLFMYQHGRILLGLRETSKAMSDIQKAVALEPKLLGGHLFLAQIYQRDLEFDQAADHFAAVLKFDDRNTTALVGLADVREGQGKHQDAADLYAKAIAVNASHLDWWLRLGSLYESNLKNTELALNTYKGLRTSLDKGDLKQRPSIDLNAKIKALEQTVSAARQPAQASAAKQDPTRSKK